MARRDPGVLIVVAQASARASNGFLSICRGSQRNIRHRRNLLAHSVGLPQNTACLLWFYPVECAILSTLAVMMPLSPEHRRQNDGESNVN